MKKLCLIGMFAAAVCGCETSPIYYVDVPVPGIAVADYDGPLTAEKISDMGEDELLRARAAEGYVLVGRADFTAPSMDDWIGRIVRQGREIKAERICYRTWYVQMHNLPGMVDVPTTYAAARTDPVQFQLETDLIADAGTLEMASNHDYDYHEYHVYYFKKLLGSR